MDSAQIDKTVLSKQFYLYESSGQFAVGYFPWRDSVIVVVFDASHTDSFERIPENSSVNLHSVEQARRDWEDRANGKKNWSYAFSVVDDPVLEARLRVVLYGLAIQFRNKEEQHISTLNVEDSEKSTVPNQAFDIRSMLRKKEWRKNHTQKLHRQYDSIYGLHKNHINPIQ